MAVKNVAKKAIDTLPDKATMDDITHTLYISAKFSDGEWEIREGR
jgi:hypothetical protein